MVSKAAQIYLAWLNEYIFVFAQVNIFNTKLMLINLSKNIIWRYVATYKEHKTCRN